MSVKQNLVTDRAREFRAHFKNTQARCIGNGNCARDCSARRAIAAAATVSSSTTGQQLVDESLGISESNFKFRRGATPKYLILLGAMGTPFAQGFRVPPRALMLSRYCDKKIRVRLLWVAMAGNMRWHEGQPCRRSYLSSKIFASKFI